MAALMLYLAVLSSDSSA